MSSADQILRSLIIEDDGQISRSIARALKSERFACHVVGNVPADLDLGPFYNCRLVIIDFMVIQAFYVDFLTRIRTTLPNARLLLLSVADEVRRELEIFGFTPDTCVVNPYDNGELAEKIALAVHHVVATPAPAPRARNPDPAETGAGAAPAITVRPAQKTAEPDATLAVPTITVRGAGPLAIEPLRSREPSERRCNIVVLGSGKGGTGKSTIAMHLIAALLQENQVVSSLDLDSNQGTLTQYVENRRAHATRAGRPFPLPKHSAIPEGEGEEIRFETALRALVDTSDHLIIDAPAGDTALSRMAHSWADTVITPINDSFVDLDVLARFEPGTLAEAVPSRYSAMIRAANDLKLRRDAWPIDWIVLRNRLSTLNSKNNARMADALAQLSGQLGFREGPGLSERVIYRELFNSGLTLVDLRDESAKVELTLSHVAARQELRALRSMLNLHGLANGLGSDRPADVLRQTA